MPVLAFTIRRNLSLLIASRIALVPIARTVAFAPSALRLNLLRVSSPRRIAGRDKYFMSDEPFPSRTTSFSLSMILNLPVRVSTLTTIRWIEFVPTSMAARFRFLLAMREKRGDSRLQGAVRFVKIARCVDHREAELLRHPGKLPKDPFLICNEAIVEIVPQLQIHSRFPVVQPLAQPVVPITF